MTFSTSGSRSVSSGPGDGGASMDACRMRCEYGVDASDCSLSSYVRSDPAHDSFSRPSEGSPDPADRWPAVGGAMPCNDTAPSQTSCIKACRIRHYTVMTVCN